ncbi:MAG: response regulator [Treponemataceae bacterium]
MDSEMKDIVDTFVTECAEHIQKATDCILLIEEKKDEEAINGLFRAFHTIKGNARMLEFNKIGSVAHSAENVMARLRNGTLTPTKQVIDLLLSALDAIGLLIAEEAEGGTLEPLHIEGLMTALEAVAKGAESPQNAQIKVKAQIAADQPTPSVNKKNSRSLNILVVEDDYLSRKTLVAMLKPYGTCDVAVNGQEAVEAFTHGLTEHPYDLVCMDIMMPRMDGFEAVRHLRSAEMIAAVRTLKQEGALLLKSKKNYYERRDTVIIMTSSLDDPENYINACYRCGANAYLVKPISQTLLRAALEQFRLL